MARAWVLCRLLKGDDGRFLYPPGWDPAWIDKARTSELIYDMKPASGDRPEVLLQMDEDSAAGLVSGSKERRWSDDAPFAMQIEERDADRVVADNETLAARGQEWCTSPDRMLAILAKKAAGIALSEADLDALDPDHPEPGIRARPTTAGAFVRGGVR